jgi:ribosomal protein L37AE/L43A
VARYILVEVDDNETAGDLVAALDGSDRVFFYKSPPLGSGGEFTIQTLTAKVVGLFAKPVKFCECPNPGDKQVRGAKFGWWVHAACGKPMKGHCQHPNNLLEPEGYKPPRDERWGYLGIWERGA